MKTIPYPQASIRSRSSDLVPEPIPPRTANTSTIPKTVAQAPLLLRVAKTMTRWGIRGGDRLVGIFGQLGILNVVAQYQLGRAVSFSVPLFRADTCWDKRDVEDYERPLIHSFCRLLEPLFDV